MSLPDTLAYDGIEIPRKKGFGMAIRSHELQSNVQYLNGMLTTHEAAKQLDLSYWHFMPLVARIALDHPHIDLTEKQAAICRYLVENERPSEIARKLQQSRQAVHSQITLIREKVSRSQAEPSPLNPQSKTPRVKRTSVPLSS